MERNSFVFYRYWYEAIKNIPGCDYGDMLTSIIEYGIKGDTAEPQNPIQKAFLTIIKSQIDLQGKRGGLKGAESDEKSLIRNSPEMRRWRQSVFDRDGYSCQHCKQIGGVLNAHHIKPFSVYPELRFDIENGLTLCRRCHIEIHRKEREWQETVS